MPRQYTQYTCGYAVLVVYCIGPTEGESFIAMVVVSPGDGAHTAGVERLPCQKPVPLPAPLTVAGPCHSPYGWDLYEPRIMMPLTCLDPRDMLGAEGNVHTASQG